MHKTPENGSPDDRPETEAPGEQDWGQNQPSARQWALLAGLGLLVLCGLAVFLISAYRSYQMWAAGRVDRTAQIAATATAEVQQRLPLLDEARGITPAEGLVGLAIGLSDPGEWVTITFDNFELRAP
ncbi:MAG: hypothetical protein MUO62_01660 [Anaerolineales bacterium]|nr:hypothetical protein [Anaerolineales bacterium]